MRLKSIIDIFIIMDANKIFGLFNEEENNSLPEKAQAIDAALD
jgi:hypothetical protein